MPVVVRVRVTDGVKTWKGAGDIDFHYADKNNEQGILLIGHSLKSLPEELTYACASIEEITLKLKRIDW
jgi:hypothetical protein